jgi:acetylornithine deacetylase
MIKIEDLLCELIKRKSVSENEKEVLDYVSNLLESEGFEVKKIAVSQQRYNIFCKVGTPTVCFSTHLDVVPASEDLFVPKIIDNRVIGRGACDAKGMVASMLAAAVELKNLKNTGFALLFVVGEETDGIGAITATKELVNSGIKYLVNGEPTEGRLVEGHKGAITFDITLEGRSCHSGYPENGIDANQKMIEICRALYDADYGFDKVFGKGTMNLGFIQAGLASNIISDRAYVKGIVRTVTNNSFVKNKIEEIVGNEGKINFIADVEKVSLKSLPGFIGGVVNYCSDIPHFLPLGCEMLMYGPGTIFEAHTNHESVGIDELYKAKDDYIKIAKLLFT